MLENKIVVVTGASQGLGRAVSIKLASLGAKVALVARKVDLLNQVMYYQYYQVCF